jgi:Zn-dependent protease/CBS domain-containing protein
MSWSWRVATVAGIPIYLHTTFVAFLGFILIADWNRGRDLGAALQGTLFVVAIFGSIVLHELGHALTARRFGIRTRDITLLPIGGLARLERMPEVPRQELWVALAGPAVNVVLAALSYVALGAFGLLNGIPDPESGDLLGRFLSVNLALAAFNMIPAFPMDGGRALRALLAERMEYVRATQTAAWLGQGLALVFGFVGLFTSPFLIFIALFVWMGASGEAAMVQMRSGLSGIPVSRAMITDFRTLDADDPLQRGVDLVLSSSQRDFPVLERHAIVGVLTREALVAALAERGPMVPVRDAMTREFQTADPREMLESAFQRLQECHCSVLPVVTGHELIGLLTAENVGEFVMLRGAVARARG